MGELSMESLQEGLLRETRPPRRMDLVESLVQGIGELPGDFVESLLVRVLRDDENCIVRHEAAFVLGRLFGRGEIRGNLAWDALSKSALSDPSVVVRHEAAESLGWFPEKRTIEFLEQLISDRNPEVADTAKLGLMRMFDELKGSQRGPE